MAERKVPFEYDLVDSIWHVPLRRTRSAMEFKRTTFAAQPTLEQLERTLALLEREGLIERGKDDEGHDAWVCTAEGRRYRRNPRPLAE